MAHQFVPIWALNKIYLFTLRKRRFNPFVVSLSNHDRIKSITINGHRQPFDKLRANG